MNPTSDKPDPPFKGGILKDWNAAVGYDPSTHPEGCHCPHPTCLAFHAARKAASDAETADLIRELEARKK